MPGRETTGVHVFRSTYRPRVIGAVLTVGCSAGALLPVFHSPFEPVAYGIRFGVVLAMVTMCVRLFRRQGLYRLEVGPAGLVIVRGGHPLAFAWDAFDSFGLPAPGMLVLRTRTRQVVTLTGWQHFDLLAGLVAGYLEHALRHREPTLPTRH